MARGYGRLILLSVFLIVDGIALWIINSNQALPGMVATDVSGNLFVINAVLVMAAVIAILAAIAFKSRPWK